MNLSGFDLNLLKVFDAMLRDGSTVAAGQRIGLSQPAVSAALGRLRHALGDELFVRSGQRLVPTETALALEPDLRDALAGIERVLSGPGALDPAVLSRTFRLCGADYVSDLILPPVMARLAREAPGVVVTHFDEIFARSLHRIREEDYDVVVLPRFDYPADLEWQPLFRSGFDVVARPDHPALAIAGVRPGQTIPLDLFCAVPQVRFAVETEQIDSSGTEDIALTAVGRARRVQMTVPTFSSVTEVVGGTDMLAVLPALTARRAEARGIVTRYAAPVPLPPLTICMVWHRRLTGSAVHQWFRDILRDVATQMHADHPLRPEDWPQDAGDAGTFP